MAVGLIVGAVASLGGAVFNFFAKKKEIDFVQRQIDERRAAAERAVKAYNDSYHQKYSQFLSQNKEKMQNEAKNLYFQRKASVLLSLVKKFFLDNILYFTILFLLLWQILKRMKPREERNG